MTGAGICFLFGLSCATSQTPPPPPSLDVAAPVVAVAAVRAPKVGGQVIVQPVPFPSTCPAQPPPGLAKHLVAAARKYPGGPTSCELAKLAFCESRFDPGAKSPAGAGGLFQFVPATADELGIDRWNDREASFGAARYQKWLRDGWTPPDFGGRTGRDVSGLGNGAWNWGRRYMYEDQSKNGWTLLDEALPHLPKETQDFVMCNERGHR